MTERWKPILGYEGAYEVSDLGRVRSLDRIVVCRNNGVARRWNGRVLSPASDNEGRAMARLYRDDRCHFVRVHRLVLEAFVGPRPEGMEGCHYDGNPTNNRLSNLRWDTRSANQRDSLRHGTQYPARLTHCPQGHPLDGTFTTRGVTKRRCSVCHRERARVRMRQNYVPRAQLEQCPGSGQRTLRGRSGERDRCPACHRLAYVRVDGTTGLHPARSCTSEVAPTDGDAGQ